MSEPNLASVQEIATGIYHVGAGAAPAESELWVDDIQVSDKSF